MMMIVLRGSSRFLDIPAYVHTCIRAYVHTCIRAYLHTCVSFLVVSAQLSVVWTHVRADEAASAKRLAPSAVPGPGPDSPARGIDAFVYTDRVRVALHPFTPSPPHCCNVRRIFSMLAGRLGD